MDGSRSNNKRYCRKSLKSFQTDYNNEQKLQIRNSIAEFLILVRMMKNEYLVAKLLYNQGVWLLLYQSCLTKCETHYYSTSILSLNHY